MVNSVNSNSNYSYTISSEQKMKMAELIPTTSFRSDEATTVNDSSTKSTMSMEDIQGSMRPQGPNGGPPPPPPSEAGDAMINSAIDTDEDDLWSTEELSAFSDSINSTTGSSFDVEELMSKYDTNGDGSIDASERTAMKEDNALKLAPPQEQQEVNDNQSIESNNVSSLLTKAMQAYDFSINIKDSFPENLFASIAV